MIRKLLDHQAQLWLYALVTTASLVHVILTHHTLPAIVNDSDSYLYFMDMRPHGYALYLKLHSSVFGSLRLLPQVHGFLFVTSIAALGLAVALKIRSGLFAAFGFLIAVYFSPWKEFYGVMSDTFYSAALSFGIAFFFLFQYFRWPAALGLASLAFGIAAATRTIGMVPLLLFIAFALLCVLQSSRSLSPRLLAATLVPALLALGVAAASSHQTNGAFRIGSWGGVSLLGKGLLLAQPLQEEHPLAELNWIAPHTNPAREAVFGTDGLWMRMLITRQYYEYLRWNLMWEKFETRWPGWYNAECCFERGRVGGSLARAYVLEDPIGYVSLVATDFGSLWLVPRLFTASEREGLLARKSVLEPLPYLTAFEATPDGSNPYFQIVPAATHPLKVWVVRFVSLTFLIGSVAWSFSVLASRRRFALLAANLDLAFIVIVVNASYAATALVEAGLERYVLPTWPALAMGILLLMHEVLRRRWLVPSEGDERSITAAGRLKGT
jgi:hypothetical protein